MSEKPVHTEDHFIQLSSIQHYVFCPRQCGLIHVEDIWRENLFTARGEILHQKVDSDTYETRGVVKTVRGLRIHSFRLGIAGRADVVEFHRSGEIIPVEFKAGKPKKNISDEAQLCAQAICLEEMLGTEVHRGAFFYGRIRRRVPVSIDHELRSQTEKIIASVHEMVSRRQVPQASYMEKCRSCSLLDPCQPKAMNTKRLNSYMRGLYEADMGCGE